MPFNEGKALVEIKDDGVEGRLHGDVNILKIQVRHREYGRVTWTTEGSEAWERLTFNESLNRIVALDRFRVEQLLLAG